MLRTTAGGVLPVTVRFEYDANGNLIGVTDAGGGVTRTQYDTVGRVTATIAPDGSRNEFTYAKGNLPFEVRYANGAVDRILRNERDQSVALTASDGGMMQLKLDAVGQVIEISGPDGAVTRSSFDAPGRPSSIVDSMGQQIDYTYAFQETSSARTTASNGATVRSEYDASGRKVAEINALGVTTRYTYDARGNLTGTVRSDGVGIRQTFDAAGRIISRSDPSGATTRLEYNSAGFLSAVIDAMGVRTEATHDELGKVTSVRDPLGHVTSMQYDNVGRMLTSTLPLGQQATFDYDILGRPKKVIDFESRTIDFVYSPDGRTVTQTADDGTIQVTRGLHGPVEVIDSRGTTRYAYDTLGRLVERVEPDGVSIRYSYDLGGKVLTLTTPGGTTTYTYNARSLIQTVTDPLGRVTLYSYNSAGLLSRTESPNGIIEVRQYDSIGLLSRIEQSRSQTVLARYDVVRDLVGRITGFGLSAYAFNRSYLHAGQGDAWSGTWDKGSLMLGVGLEIGDMKLSSNVVARSGQPAMTRTMNLHTWSIDFGFGALRGSDNVYVEGPKKTGNPSEKTLLGVYFTGLGGGLEVAAAQVGWESLKLGQTIGYVSDSSKLDDFVGMYNDFWKPHSFFHQFLRKYATFDVGLKLASIGRSAPTSLPIDRPSRPSRYLSVKKA